MQKKDTTAHEYNGFSWPYEGQINVLDHGARLPGQSFFGDLITPENFAYIGFDPSGRFQDDKWLKEQEHIQLLTFAALGDGQTTPLYACMDASKSATLKPLTQASYIFESQKTATQVIAELSAGTLALDAIEELDTIDWLLLDDKNNNQTILEHGAKALENTLLIQARVPFMPAYEGQTTFGQIDQWMTQNGFQCYHITNQQHHSHMPFVFAQSVQQASQLQSAEVLYLPNMQRMAALTDNQRVKLAFLMHNINQIEDLPYKLLSEVDFDLGEQFLQRDNNDTGEDSFSLSGDDSPAPWDETEEDSFTLTGDEDDWAPDFNFGPEDDDE